MKTVMMAAAVLALAILAMGGCSKKAADNSGGGKETEGGPEKATGSSSRTAAKAPTGSAPLAPGSIRMGMTLDEVKALLGRPQTQMAMGETDGKEVLHCVWQKGDTFYSVQFHDGKVAVFQEGTESAEPTPAAGDQVKKNFDKVKMGMSEAEVVKLLGPPTNATSTGAEGQSFAVKTWETADGTYAVTFVDGKVQMMHAEAAEE